MSDINFLQDNKKNKSSKKGGKNEERKIEWTKPAKGKAPAPQKAKDGLAATKSEKVAAKAPADKIVFFSEEDSKRSAGFGLFKILSFFGKNKKNEQNDLLSADAKPLSSLTAAKEPKKNFGRKEQKPAALSVKKEKEKKEQKKESVENIEENEKEEKNGLAFRVKTFFSRLRPAGEKDGASGRKEIRSRPFPGVSEKEPLKRWEKSRVLETNLIKGELASFFNWKKGILILAIYSLVSGLVVAGFYGGLSLWEKQIKRERSEYSNRIRDLDEKVIKPLEEEAKKILSEQERIKLAGTLLKKHIYWTNFFEFLENNTLPDVYYTSDFSGGIDGKYSLSARSKDFKTILEQVDIMRENENVKEAAVDGGSVVAPAKKEQNDGERSAEGGVDFKLKLIINPSLFTE